MTKHVKQTFQLGGRGIVNVQMEGKRWKRDVVILQATARAMMPALLLTVNGATCPSKGCFIIFL